MRIRDAWWKPDLRWHLNAVMPVFAVLAFGSLILGAYKGLPDAPVLVGIASGLEFVALSAVAAWLFWEVGAFAYRGESD